MAVMPKRACSTSLFTSILYKSFASLKVYSMRVAYITKYHCLLDLLMHHNRKKTASSLSQNECIFVKFIIFWFVRFGSKNFMHSRVRLGTMISVLRTS